MMLSGLSMVSGEVPLNSQARIAPVHTLLNVLLFLSKMTYSGGVRFALSAPAGWKSAPARDESAPA